jgi:hypothetical protein
VSIETKSNSEKWIRGRRGWCSPAIPAAQQAKAEATAGKSPKSYKNQTEGERLEEREALSSNPTPPKRKNRGKKEKMAQKGLRATV